jgi:ATP-dependent Lhr-like helicase
VLLITPESLEALFVSSGHSMRQMFRYLRFVVIDELHSFIGTERGKQLQSLLHRLETSVGHQIPRVGLSATLGELQLAAGYLRPSHSNAVHIIESGSNGQELKLVIHGYEEAPQWEEVGYSAQGADDDGRKVNDTKERISEDLYRSLRGTSSLIFANSRSDVEVYADLLRTRCEQEGLPVEFLPHHGSLSKEHREQVEETLKDRSRPATAVCTSTLELGIDIGSVTSVAQVGSPFSVASLRQRLGRSGRRNEPAVLRLYVEESCLTDSTAPVDAIRAELVQSIALIRLLLARWCEPPETQGLHLSTLVHQTLSLIAEKSGVLAADAWRILCREGPFHNVTASHFAELLRALGSANILMQSDAGLLLLAPGGEKIVNHYRFYAVFSDSHRVSDRHRLRKKPGDGADELSCAGEHTDHLRRSTLACLTGRWTAKGHSGHRSIGRPNSALPWFKRKHP